MSTMCLPVKSKPRGRARVACPSVGGYQPIVPLVPPPEELLVLSLLGEEVVVSGYVYGVGRN